MAQLRILHLEDNPVDAELVKRELGRSGIPCEIQVVDNGKKFEHALQCEQVDLILSDYSLPAYNGTLALEYAKKFCPNVPFVFVTGEMGEDRAIESLKQGAIDYVMKDRLSKLGPAVHHALEVDTFRQQQRAAEETLRQSREWYATTLKSIGDAVIATDAAGKVTFLNPVAERLTGWTSADAVGNDIANIFHIVNEATGEPTPDPVERVLREGTIAGLANHTILNRRDGTSIAIDDSGAPISNEDGTIIGAVLVFRDVSKDREAHKLIEQQAALIDLSPDALVVMAPDGTIQFWNNGAERLYQYSRQDVIGQSIHELLKTKFPEPLDRMIATVLSTGYWEGELIHTRRDGSTAIVQSRWLLQPDEAGTPPAIFESNFDLTERKAAEEALQDGERKYRALFENKLFSLVADHSPVSIIITDTRGVIEYVNPQFTALTGYSPEEVIGRNPRILKSGHTSPEEYRELWQTISSGGTWQGEFHNRKKNGELYWELASIAPVRDINGQITNYVAMKEDFTGRKKMEEDLLDLARFPDENPNPILRITRDGRILYANHHGQRFLKKWKRSIGQTIHADWLNTVREALHRDVEIQREEQFGTRLFSIIARPVIARDYVNLYGRDITEQRKAETQLRQMNVTLERHLEEITESREKFAKAFHANTAGMVISRANDGLILDVNDRWCTLMGYSREEAIGKTSRSINMWKHAQDRDHIASELERLGTIIDREYTLVRKNGEEWTCLLSVSTSKLQGEKVFISSVLDISERKKNEEALRESEERFRALADNIPQLAWMADETGGLFWYNKRWFDYTGTTLEEMLGWGWQKVHHPDHVERVTRKFKQNVESGEVWEDTFPLRSKEGEFRWFLSRATPIRNDQGNIVRWFGTNTDITEKLSVQEKSKRLNEELEQRVKERTGELTAANKELESFSYAVSHDLRAPLRAISGFANIMLEENPEQLTLEQQRHLGLIRDNIAHLGHLVEEILKFSRLSKQELSKTMVDMKTMTEELLQFQTESNRGRSVKVALDNLPPVQADAILIRQVMENLISNAVKFSRDKEQPVIEIGGYRNTAEVVYFVQDNGAGFDMHYYNRLFGFFQRLHSAKEFEGTGVGLAFCQRIIQRHGGRMWAEGEVDKGATFYFSLPVKG